MTSNNLPALDALTMLGLWLCGSSMLTVANLGTIRHD